MERVRRVEGLLRAAYPLRKHWPPSPTCSFADDITSLARFDSSEKNIRQYLDVRHIVVKSSLEVWRSEGLTEEVECNLDNEEQNTSARRKPENFWHETFVQSGGTFFSEDRH